MFSRLICLIALSVVVMSSVDKRRKRYNLNNSAVNQGNDDSELLLSFVMFRHGDRTPNEHELSTFPSANINTSIFYPYGLKALTNAGKMRGYAIGRSLRKRFNGFLSDMYIPEDIIVQSSHSARAKMTALTALAALYPPNDVQKWNTFLNWQPIPYKSHGKKHDELHAGSSCQVIKDLRKQVYKLPDVHKRIMKYKDFLNVLSEKTGYEFKTPKDVHRFNNLILGLENVRMDLPHWINETKPSLQELTELAFECYFYTDQLKRLGGGVFVHDFISASRAALAGEHTAKVHLLGAHESSVAGFMAAATVFTPQQPGYGATFCLELRRNKMTNEFGVMASYMAVPGKPFKILPIPGCGRTLCNFDTFVKLTQKYAISKGEYFEECQAPVIV